MLSAFSARAYVLIMLTVHEAKTAARTESADTPTVYIILFSLTIYSKAPMRSISTSFSVRNLQSPRRRFFFVSPANCTRSSFTT